MKALLKLVSLSVVLCLNLPDGLFLQPQEIKFEHISLAQGLSQSSVRCILQDSKGFMWFGTEDGLNRYDGYNFKVFRKDPQNANSLSDNSVRFIYEDRSDVLWIGTKGGGLNKFDREQQKFTPYKSNSNNPNSLSHNNVWSIYEDRSGALWIGTLGGLNRLVPSENEGSPPTFIHYKTHPDNPNSLSSSRVLSIYEDRSEILWIGTHGGGLNRLRSENEGSPATFTHYKHDPKNLNSLSHNTVRVIQEDPAQPGVLWIGTNGGGLSRFDVKQQKFTHYRNDSNNANSLGDNTVFSICVNRSGVLWIGTLGGLNRLVPSENEGSPPTFIHYKNEPNNPNSLASQSMRTAQKCYGSEPGVEE